MDRNKLITIDLEDKETNVILCTSVNSIKELTSFLLELDTDKYNVFKIDVVGYFDDSYYNDKSFFYKPKKDDLEFGKK